MVRSIWRGTLVMVLACVGLSLSQPARPGSGEQGTIIVHENGKNLECRLLRAWKQKDGTEAYEVQVLQTEEMLTLKVEGPARTPSGMEAKMRAYSVRVFHWGRLKTPPPGAPLPPDRVASQDQHQQIAHKDGPTIVSVSEQEMPTIKASEQATVARRGPVAGCATCQRGSMVSASRPFPPNTSGLRPPLDTVYGKVYASNGTVQKLASKSNSVIARTQTASPLMETGLEPLPSSAPATPQIMPPLAQLATSTTRSVPVITARPVTPAAATQAPTTDVVRTPAMPPALATAGDAKTIPAAAARPITPVATTAAQPAECCKMAPGEELICIDPPPRKKLFARLKRPTQVIVEHGPVVIREQPLPSTPAKEIITVTPGPQPPVTTSSVAVAGPCSPCENEPAHVIIVPQAPCAPVTQPNPPQMVRTAETFAPSMNSQQPYPIAYTTPNVRAFATRASSSPAIYREQPVPSAFMGEQLPEKASMAQIIALLQDSVLPSEREMAVLKLAGHDLTAHPEIAQVVLNAAQKDPAATVRAACVRCLARQCGNNPLVRNTLGSLRNDRDPRVRQAADQALNGLGETQNLPGLQPVRNLP
jgi:hypothetical protein